jgi:hypothetical protein
LAGDPTDSSAESAAGMSDEQLQIQKRFTLNWLIQGAAQHAGMTFHHLVRDELNAISPKLLHFYDQYALINLLQYWQPEAKLLLGSPERFWERAARRADHPFTGIRCFPNTEACSRKPAGNGDWSGAKKKDLRDYQLPFHFNRCGSSNV